MSKMNGNVTPPKRGIQVEKQPKLTAHEKPPAEHKLIHAPRDEVAQAEAVGDDGISSEIVKAKRRDYCRIHKCFTDHNYMSCPDKEKYYVLYEGFLMLILCPLCDFDHVGAECPYLVDCDNLYA